MAGDVETEQLFFMRQQFVLRPFGEVADAFGHGGRFFFQRAEQRALALLLVRQNAGRAREGALDLGEQRRARLAKGVAGAGFDERFERFAGDRTAIHALAQFGQRLEFSVFVAGLEDGFHRDFAHTLDGGEAEADVL